MKNKSTKRKHTKIINRQKNHKTLHYMRGMCPQNLVIYLNQEPRKSCSHSIKCLPFVA